MRTIGAALILTLVLFTTICQGEDQAEDDRATEKMELLETFLIACFATLGIGIIICLSICILIISCCFDWSRPILPLRFLTLLLDRHPLTESFLSHHSSLSYVTIFVLLKIVCANAFLIKDWNKRIFAWNLVINRKFNCEVSYFRIRRYSLVLKEETL